METQSEKSNVVGTEVTYFAKSGTEDGDSGDKSAEVALKGYLVKPANVGANTPAVLVVHEWWGHNDYARKRARMLAKLGYVALAVDMYGDGKQAQHPKDAMKFSQEVMGNLPEAERRFESARQFLADDVNTDPTRIAAIGYCFGGGVVLHAARKGMGLVAVASFHGGLDPSTEIAPGTNLPRIAVFNGGADPMVPSAKVEAFKKEMDDAGASTIFVNYPGVQHAFTNPEADSLGKKYELPLAYNASADEDSWTQMTAFLAAAFSARS